ncbi:hypothetical protein ABT187_42115 [Streptomyces sp. NPDC001817]|uniref:hypothetical protein n=1 Tax=Streptomyces sp. NPDC001817 TaxID=3154398 RepID=UPI0033249D75
MAAGLREAMDHVRRSVAVLAVRVRDAHDARVWLPLGYGSWEAYCDAEFKHLAALRAGTTEPVRADTPSPRKITSWIMRPRQTSAESQDERLLQARLACPDIARACDLARAFADLVRHQRGYLLLEWIRQAEQDAPKPMKSFVGAGESRATESLRRRGR